MDYFVLRQDRTVEKPVKPTNLKEVLGKVDEAGSLFGEVKVSDDAWYVDYLDGAVPIVSDAIKHLLSRYENALRFTAIVFTDTKQSAQSVYWFMEARVINCLSKETEYEPNGVIRKLVIRAKKVSLDSVFLVEDGINRFIIVSQDVAESMLRRSFIGIELEKLALDWS